MFQRFSFKSQNEDAASVFAEHVAAKCGNPRVSFSPGVILFVWTDNSNDLRYFDHQRVWDGTAYVTFLDYFRDGLTEVSRGTGEPR